MLPEEKAPLLYNEYVYKGLSFREIAIKYDSSHQNVSLILKGRLTQEDLEKHNINRTERKYQIFKQTLANID